MKVDDSLDGNEVEVEKQSKTERTILRLLDLLCDQDECDGTREKLLLDIFELSGMADMADL